MSRIATFKTWMNQEREERKVIVTRNVRINQVYVSIIYLFFSIGLFISTNLFQSVLKILYLWTDVLNLTVPRFLTFHPILQGIIVILVFGELFLALIVWFFPGVYWFVTAERILDKDWPNNPERTKKWRAKRQVI